MLEGDGIFLTLAAHPHFQAHRQSVDHGDAHPVQTTGKLIILAGEFAAGVQARENQFDPGNPLLGVNVHRHAATVIDHLQRVVLVQDNGDRPGVPGQRFVDAVVDDFLGQVVGTGGVGVHARATAHRIQAAENFNIIGVIGRLGHRVSGFP